MEGAVPTGLTATARTWLLTTAVVTVVPYVAAIVLAPAGDAKPGASLAWLLFLGTSVHVASTLWLFTLPEVRACVPAARTRFLIVPLALVVAGAAGAGLLSERQLAWVLVPFLAWQLHHYQRQNLGLVAITARSARAAGLRPLERRVLVASGFCAIAALLSRPERLQLVVDPHVRWLFPVTAVAAAATGVAALWCADARRRAGEPLVALTLAAGCAFFVPVYVLSSPYAAVAGLTVAHGLQYLVLLGLVGAERQRTSVVAPAAFLGIAVVGGALLHTTSHLHDAASPATRAVYGAYLGLVMAHFVVDAGIWRLSDPHAARFVRAYLPQLVGRREATPT